MKYFKILSSEGKSFSKLSGDNNQIHLNDLTGYNSIFGEKICHGCLVILKIFKIINLQKIINKSKKYSIKIIFFKHIVYDQKIKIIKKNYSYKIIQQNQLIAELIIINRNKILNYNLGKKKLSLKINKKSFNNFYSRNQNKDLPMLLANLTKYVGTIYPGKNSLIREININFNKNFKFDNHKTNIFSKKVDARYPIINNKILFKNYFIEFVTLQRPEFKHKKSKIKKTIKKSIKKIKENILILGASSGIGLELLNVMKYNKKIKIFGTYRKNKILIKQKNLRIEKVDLNKSFYEIEKILDKVNSLIIYYFATPKIDININNKKSLKIYKKFYIRYPLKILSFCKNKNIKFFYPSTTFIGKNNSYYAKIKEEAEKKIVKLKHKQLYINILRINEINTKQNLSLVQKKLPSFIDLLNLNKEYQNKVFFKK